MGGVLFQWGLCPHFQLKKSSLTTETDAEGKLSENKNATYKPRRGPGAEPSSQISEADIDTSLSQVWSPELLGNKFFCLHCPVCGTFSQHPN